MAGSSDAIVDPALPISWERAAEFGWADDAASAKGGAGGADMIIEGGRARESG